MDTKTLIEIANNDDGLGTTDFDNFLRLHGYTTKDTSERILLDDVYFFYSEYYYDLYDKLPSRKHFAENSYAIQQNRLRQRNPKNKQRFKWGIKCSKHFKDSFLEWQKNNKRWHEKFQKLQHTAKSLKEKKRAAKERKMLSIEKSRMLDLIKPTSQK